MRKLIGLNLGLGLVLGLAACSSTPNPLLTQDLQKIIQVLSDAEYPAMKTQNLYYGTGSIYVKCMTDPQNFAPLQPIKIGQELCDGVLNMMAQEARKTPGFENLNLADLKDPKAFQRIREGMAAKDAGEEISE